VSHTPSSASSTRITMVYTPVEHRGHGYARTAGGPAAFTRGQRYQVPDTLRVLSESHARLTKHSNTGQRLMECIAVYYVRLAQ
jgi:hypothetical protein